MKLRFPKLAAAVAEYDRTAPTRRRLWDLAMTEDEMDRAVEADKEARLKVREALAEDDPGQNRMFPGMHTARQWAKLTLR